MSTKIEICNMALFHLGTTIEIQDINERTKEAKALKTFYKTALNACCRDFDWQFTKQIVKLQLVEETPNSEWQYSYRYPNSANKVKRILHPGSRDDAYNERVPFDQSSDSSGKLIFCDQPEAYAEISVTPANESFFHADFVLAFSYRLAFYIAPSLTGGNAFTGLGDSMMAKYMNELSLAMRNAANERQKDPELPSSLELAREDGVRSDRDGRFRRIF